MWVLGQTMAAAVLRKGGSDMLRALPVLRTERQTASVRASISSTQLLRKRQRLFF